MAEPQSGLSWAQRIAIETFAEHGKALHKDDPIILVALVLRRAMDEAQKELDAKATAQASMQALAFSRRAETALETLVSRLGTGGVSATNSEAQSNGDSDRWRNRFEGLCVGAALVALGVLLRSFMH